MENVVKNTNEVKGYCKICKSEHILSQTRDNEGNIVGLFCNTRKRVVVLNKMAYQFTQTEFAKENRVNYFFTLCILEDMLFWKMKELKRKRREEREVQQERNCTDSGWRRLKYEPTSK
ncbi:hypothetical protein [Chengkuizengella axinellae]|uniref:Uncharacterized protein n=1 Tax=Chengkuizengella axinellae TaxID=3064388 RepID=A0ABT9IV38_9BACL|nr:hypothetical protein [Chengkuizengella sp. 2205SS18-9]MDP5273218.1 hypothetical protein [Chengkuizengella sp. 2205SS18-9]